MKSLKFLIIISVISSFLFSSCKYEFPDDEMVGSWVLVEFIIHHDNDTKTITSGHDDWEDLAIEFGYNKFTINADLTYDYIDYWGETTKYTWERLSEEKVRLWKDHVALVILRKDELRYYYYPEISSDIIEVKWSKKN